MFDFNMTTEQNFASFKCTESDLRVFVDSFDNENFEVRLGTVSTSKPIGEVQASTDEDLNESLKELVSEAVA